MSIPSRSSRPRLRRAATLLLAAVAGITWTSHARAEDPPAPPPAPVPPRGAPERTAWRESMWAAPTAQDWEKPCLLRFQRTWDDAVAVAREEGRPILVCINMDGEIASEHYAGVRYRQPEIAALYEPYVCVIASVYRHNPRDHDDEGRRVLCPRFGSVTCGEHIAIEPTIFEKFCDGQRVAPRHICVELDGKETYDVFYANDTASVFQAVREGISKRPPLPARAVRGDRPVLERVASREASDRTAVETAYAAGDAAARRAILDAAAARADVAPLDLLRLAVFGLDPDFSRSARRALASVETPAATDLVAEALRVPMDAAERDALLAALRRLGAKSELARWLAVVHQGLAGPSQAVDVERWGSKPVEGEAPPALAEGGDLYAGVEGKEGAAKARPLDPQARLDAAEAALRLSLEPRENLSSDPKLARVFARGMLGAAKRGALEAERLGATGWRVNAVAALAAYYAGETTEAFERAALAVADLPPGDGTWTSMAVLTVFAEGRWRAMRKAVKEKTDFPPQWLTDVNAAYAVLLRHPMGTPGQVLWHQDTLDWLGAVAQATAVLERGLTRFPDSPEIHARMRQYVLSRKGPAGLEATYDRLAKVDAPSPGLPYWAGLAATAAAESHRRGGGPPPPHAPDHRPPPPPHPQAPPPPPPAPPPPAAIALALAGRARVALEGGDLERALAEILASFERSHASAGTRDGMGMTPAETALMLLPRLRDAKSDRAATRLEVAISRLDPELLPADGE